MKHTPYLLLVGIILVLAEVFRFFGTNWDANTHLQPDERFLTMVTTNIRWPDSIIEYFDTDRSPLNPHNNTFSFYVYGTYPVFLVRTVSEALGKLTYNGVTTVGRMVSAAVDLLTVFFVFLIGFHASGKRWAVGLTAALLYALMPLPIQLSHFYTVDPFVTLFSTASLYAMIRGKPGIILGSVVALAVSAKISAILLVVVVSVYYLIAFISVRGTIFSRERIAVLIDALLFLLSFVIVVRIAYPYLFRDFHLNSRVLSNWKELTSFDGPTTSFPPGIQWIHVSPLQPLMDMVVWGFGLPQGLLFGVALLWQSALLLARKRDRRVRLLLLTWTLCILLYQSTRFAKPMRYFWPMYPVVAVLISLTLRDLVRTPWGTHIRRFAFIVCILILVPPLFMLSIYGKPNTRVQASRWFFANAPHRSVIAWEHWDDPLPLPVDNQDTSVFTQVQLPVFDPDGIKKWTTISETLAKSRYVVVSSNRGYGSMGRAKARFPQTSRYYQLLFDGKLGFTVTKQFISRPSLPVPGVSLCIPFPGFTYGKLSNTHSSCPAQGIQFIDDYADETFTVYDHPVVTIFENTGLLSQSTLYSLLVDGKSYEKTNIAP